MAWSPSRNIKGVTRVALVLQDQSINLQPPFPRKLNPGQAATLSGSVLGKLSNPKVQFSNAVGHLEQPKGTPSKTTTPRSKCGDHRAECVQVSRRVAGGGDVRVAGSRVGCAACGFCPWPPPFPRAVRKRPRVIESARRRAAGRQLINRAGAPAGLKPLEVDGDLAKVARSISEDRAKGKGTTSEELQQRLKELDISAPALLVSEAQAYGAEEAYQHVSNSPQDRANAMNPDMTQVGIGIAPGPTVNDRQMIIVTELFMKQLPPPDPAEVKAKLYQAIERRRTDARAGAAGQGPQLERDRADSTPAEMAKDKGTGAEGAGDRD